MHDLLILQTFKKLSVKAFGKWNEIGSKLVMLTNW
jgi:hypothetical protein